MRVVLVLHVLLGKVVRNNAVVFVDHVMEVLDVGDGSLEDLDLAHSFSSLPSKKRSTFSIGKATKVFTLFSKGMALRSLTKAKLTA